MNPFDIAEQANIEMAREVRRRLDRLNASLAYLDEQALKFDPDASYRAEVKARIEGEAEPERKAA